MEVNKAKFHLIRLKRQVSQNRIEINQLQKQLKLLNGGEEMKFDLTTYPVFPEMPVDSILAERKESTPGVKIASQHKTIAESSVKLERSLNGPEFNLGYGSETVGNSSFKGVLFGASIPLWTNKNKVKAAQAEVGYMEMEYENKLLELRNETQKQYDTYLSLKESMEEYASTIEELESVQLLRKSLKLDQISALDFYREVEYYYTIYDEYLKLERDYYLALCELYRYRL